MLPRFADALNEMLPNVDTDNLETSLNRLKNAFTGLVNKSDVQSKYKSIIDWLTGYIKTAADNIQSLITYVVTAISVLVTSRLVNKLLISFQKTELAAKAAARRAAKAAGQSFDEVAWRSQKATSTMRMMFANAVKSIKTALVSIAPTAVIAAIGAIVAKLVVMYQEAKRIKNLFSDYKAELGKSTNTSDIVNLQTQYKIATDLNRSIDERKAALSKINQQLNTNYSIDEKNLVIQGDLNKKFAERVELLKAAAEVDYLTQKKLAVEDKISELKRKREQDQQNTEFNREKAGKGIGIWFEAARVAWGNAKEVVEFDDKEIIEQNKILADINTKLEQSTAKANAIGFNPDKIDQGGIEEGQAQKTTLQKLEEKSAKELSELEAKYKIGSISQAEYNKALAELNIKLYAEASGSNDRKVLESDFYKKLKETADAAVRQKDALAGAVELENVQKEYSKRLAELSAQKANGLITEKQYRKNVQALAVEMDKAASSISGIGVEGQAFITAMRMNAQLMGTPTKKKERDTTFDYKKTTIDIAQENLDLAKDYAKDLQEEARNAGKILDEELAKAMANVPDLEKALKIAQVRQDIKDLGKELKQGMFSGVKNIASSADRMVSAFTQLRDVMDDEDASAWERIMAVWNVMVNSVDSFMSIIQTIDTLRELTEKLGKAKEAEAAIDTATTAAKVTNATTEAAVDTATTGVEVVNAGKKVAANTAEGASDAGKSAAKLPFPANIIAIGAAIAAAIAAFSVIPKFANGGVVSGRTLAEVGEYPGASSNPEVIAPLSKLKDMIGGTGMANVRVEVGGKMQLDGDTAYLQLKNYGKRTGKKIF